MCQPSLPPVECHNAHLLILIGDKYNLITEVHSDSWDGTQPRLVSRAVQVWYIWSMFRLISSKDICYIIVNPYVWLTWYLFWHQMINLHLNIGTLSKSTLSYRPDRNAFVYVHGDRINLREMHNFDKHEHASTIIPYDISSVMHYSKKVHITYFYIFT